MILEYLFICYKWKLLVNKLDFNHHMKIKTVLSVLVQKHIWINFKKLKIKYFIKGIMLLPHFISGMILIRTGVQLLLSTAKKNADEWYS